MHLSEATVYEYTPEEIARKIARAAMGRYINNKIINKTRCVHTHPYSWQQFAGEFEGVAVEYAVCASTGRKFDLLEFRKGKIDLPGVEIKGNAFRKWSTLIRPDVLEPLVDADAVIVSGWIEPVRTPAACYMGWMMAADVERSCEWDEKQQSRRITEVQLRPLNECPRLRAVS